MTISLRGIFVFCVGLALSMSLTLMVKDKCIWCRVFIGNRIGWVWSTVIGINVGFNSLKLAEPMTFKHICDYEITNMHCKFLITPQLTLKALMEKLFFEWSRTVGQNKSQLQSKTYSRFNTLYNYMHLYLCKCCIISMNTPRVTTLDT